MMGARTSASLTRASLTPFYSLISTQRQAGPRPCLSWRVFHLAAALRAYRARVAVALRQPAATVRAADVNGLHAHASVLAPTMSSVSAHTSASMRSGDAIPGTHIVIWSS